MIMDRLYNAALESPVCVGLDPVVERVGDVDRLADGGHALVGVDLAHRLGVDRRLVQIDDRRSRIPQDVGRDDRIFRHPQDAVVALAAALFAENIVEFLGTGVSPDHANDIRD